MMVLLAAGCGGSREKGDIGTAEERSPNDAVAADTATIDPADLEPDALVFAAGRGGGFLMSPEQIFFVEHYGDFRLYVLGDRRVVRLDQGTIPELGYRVLRQAKVPEETFEQLLALAAKVGPDDAGEYQRCPALDGPTESLYVAVPGVTVTASCFSSFSGWPDCEDRDQDWEKPPPEELVALHAALLELKELPGEILETDRILFGGYLATGPGLPENCDGTNAVAWPFDDSAAFPGNEDYGFWSMALEGGEAGKVRDFLRANLSGETYYPSACVGRGGQFYRVFYDDMLPGEEEFPF